MSWTQQKVLDALDPHAPRTLWPVGTRTIAQIAEATGQPRSTVRDAVASLLAAGKVEGFGISCNDARVYALTGYTAAWHRQGADFFRHEIGHYWDPPEQQAVAAAGYQVLRAEWTADEQETRADD